MKKDLDSTHIMQNGTGYQLRDALDSIAKSLKILAVTESANVDLTNYRHIQNIVQLGKAKEYFQIGDQIHTTWSPDGETEYDMPWDVVDFGPATDPDGVVHENAMWLQSHYTLPEAQFDQSEAFYVAPEAMPAGTYHFSFGATLSAHAPAGVPFMFTLTKAVPAGGMLILGTETSDRCRATTDAVSNWRVRVYANGAQADPDEVVEVSQGDDGTDLGMLLPISKDRLNDVFRLFGYNRWSQSAIRQWLNSDKPVGEWWKQQNPFDRRPEQLAIRRGFIAGLSSNFLAIAKPVKIITIINEDISYDPLGKSETTIDRFFLASLGQEYIMLPGPQWDAEGTAFKYWVDRLGTQQKTGGSNKRTEHIRYSINNVTSASYSRLRSGSVPMAMSVYQVNNVGTVGLNSAHNNISVDPVCVIY